MKKVIFLGIAFVCASLMLNAQKMDVGTNFLSLGIGPSTPYGFTKSAFTPAMKIAFDHGFKEIGPGYLTMGGALGFFNNHFEGNYTYVDNFILKTAKYKENYLTIMAAFRVGYYYNFKELINTPQLNAYAGIASGIRYSIYNKSYTGPDSFAPNGISGARFHMAGYAGANYFVSKNIAFFTEFGYDISYFTLGVTFKL